MKEGDLGQSRHEGELGQYWGSWDSHYLPPLILPQFIHIYDLAWFEHSKSQIHLYNKIY